VIFLYKLYINFVKSPKICKRLSILLNNLTLKVTLILDNVEVEFTIGYFVQS